MLVVVAGIDKSSSSPASRAVVGGGGSGGRGCHRWWRCAPHRHPRVDAGQGGGVAVAVVPLVVPLLLVPVLLLVSSSSPSSSPLSLSPSLLSSCCRGIGHGRHIIVVAVSTQGRVMLVVPSLCMRAVVGGGGCRCWWWWVVSSPLFGWEVVVEVMAVVVGVIATCDGGDLISGGGCC